MYDGEKRLRMRDRQMRRTRGMREPLSRRMEGEGREGKPVSHPSH